MGNINNIDQIPNPIHQGRRIPTIPVHWQNFFLSILFRSLMPLLPILLEFIKNGKVNDASVVLSTSMYIITVGITSTDRLMFGLTIIGSIIFAFLYGTLPNTQQVPSFLINISVIVLVFTFILNSLERYNRHCVDRSPIFEFMSN